VERIRQAGVALNVGALAIKGRDLIDVLGMQPGPAIGALLNDLLEAVLVQPQLNEREALLQLARTLRRAP
jgi:tRNA nucleotidyltransferase (CCA-adding enzyme)